MKRAEVRTNPRFAGMVERYHTWPMIRRESVAEHSWHVHRIWSEIFGPPPTDVSEYILWHDCGELVTGDPPFPVKRDNPDLKAAYDRVEDNARAEMKLPDYRLTTINKLKVKVCDLVDMMEVGIIERRMGNQFAHPIIDDTCTNIGELLTQIPRDDCYRVQEYVVVRWGITIWVDHVTDQRAEC